jgi:hypothetical protein
MKLNVIDGSAPLIPCKEGNLRIFMEQKKKKHFKDIQLGDFFVSQTGCAFGVLKRSYGVRCFSLFWKWT